MVKLYKEISYEAGVASGFDYRIRDLERKLEQTKGLFKGNERKAIQDEISATVAEKVKHEKRINTVVKQVGYPNVQSFITTFRQAEKLVQKYEQEMIVWKERSFSVKELGMNYKQPEKRSVREELKRLTQAAKSKPIEKYILHQLER